MDNIASRTRSKTNTSSIDSSDMTTISKTHVSSMDSTAMITISKTHVSGIDSIAMRTRSKTYEYLKENIISSIGVLLKKIAEADGKNSKVIFLEELYYLINKNKYYLKFMNDFGLTARTKLIELFFLEDSKHFKKIFKKWYLSIYDRSISSDIHNIKKKISIDFFFKNILIDCVNNERMIIINKYDIFDGLYS